MKTSTSIDAVAFDYGNVISRAQDPSAIARLIGMTKVPASAFAARYAADRLAYDRGALTGAEYWSRFLSGTGVAASDDTIAWLIAEDVGGWLAVDDRMLAWATRLKAAGVRTAILSNMPADVLAGLRHHGASWLREFDVTIFSCEHGCVKPDAAIYRALVAALGAPPARVLFIDDVDVNVTAARQAGLHALQYTSFEVLDKEVLAAYALPAPLGDAGRTNRRRG